MARELKFGIQILHKDRRLTVWQLPLFMTSLPVKPEVALFMVIET